MIMENERERDMARLPDLLVAAVASLALPALADTRIEYVDEASNDTATEFLIKDGKVRMNDPDEQGYTLYDHNTKLLTFVDHGEKTYTEMDEASMEKMSSQVNAAMQEMRKQMEQMTPEQRAMMEKMMGGASNAGKSMFEMDVERTGKHQQKAGHKCEQVFFTVGSMARTELCVVDPDEIDMPAADRRALDGMQEQMRLMAEKMTESIGVNFTFDFESMGGLPVYMKEDNETSGQVLDDVSHARLDASLFEVPKGYRKDELSLE